MKPRTSSWRIPRQIVLFILGLIPLGGLIGQVVIGDPGPNPVETLLHGTGLWALRWLCLVLAITPLYRYFSNPWLLTARRPVGLLAFTYATVHLLVYGVLDQGLDWAFIWEDLGTRVYLMVGLTAWLLLLPPAVTSFTALQRRWGRAWKRVHALTYPAAALAAVHFLWLVKADTWEPMVYLALVLALLTWRLRIPVK